MSSIDPVQADDGEWEDTGGEPLFWDPASAFDGVAQVSSTPSQVDYTPGVGFAGFLNTSCVHLTVSALPASDPQHSVPFKTREDNRTRAEQLRSEHEAWTALMPVLAGAYLQWKHGGTEPPSDTSTPPADAQEHDGWFTIHAVRESGASADVFIPVPVC